MFGIVQYPYVVKALGLACPYMYIGTTVVWCLKVSICAITDHLACDVCVCVCVCVCVQLY